MNRREAIRTAGVVLGGIAVASDGVLAGCAPAQGRGGRTLSGRDQELVDEIGDTLLPTTAASPGAKAAGVGAGVNLILSDCYKPEDQRRIVQGLVDFRATCEQRAHKDFLAMSRAEREGLLRSVAADAKKVGDSHYFGLLRDLIQGAYFSSEIGTTKALRYIMVPGRFDGCVPLVPGQPAWA